MNRPLKLVVSGPVGSGKTTFIQSLSEIPVVETDEWASEEIDKEKTTVALDYGLLTLDGVLSIYTARRGRSASTSSGMSLWRER